mmetsp:Transcript_26691/g.84945  ORF Transcript_26691/g.84945 Transcript_26691/m.84945 type:complete len:316 (-) Transcript_26691:318-1265(-)
MTDAQTAPMAVDTPDATDSVGAESAQAREIEQAQDQEDAAAAFQRLHPRAFFERFVEQGVRPDGRSLVESRPVVIESGVVGAADGSACVSLGATRVMCGVRFLTGPPTRRPDEGEVQVSVRLLPICAPQYENLRESLEGASLTAYLQQLIESGWFDRSQLCIEEGVACFTLLADIVCLADDGNLTDACTLALASALRDVRLPKMAVVQNKNAGGPAGPRRDMEIVQLGTDRPNKLSLDHDPRPTTFGIFGSKFLVDPTHEELEVLDGTVSIVASPKGAVLAVFKPDGPPLLREELSSCLDMAISRARSKSSAPPP